MTRITKLTIVLHTPISVKIPNVNCANKLSCRQSANVAPARTPRLSRKYATSWNNAGMLRNAEATCEVGPP